MTPQRILITGSSGYYGRAVVKAIRARWPAAVTLGLDMIPPRTDPPDDFQSCDITSDAVSHLAAAFKPDTMIHLAYVVNPTHDDRRMHEVNVGGTRNFLAAAAAVQPARIMVSSSATAYGAWPDNPVPMTEDQPLRARTDLRYAADKTQIESLLAEFRTKHPGITTAWTRPCMIYGPGMSNFMTTLFTVSPLLTLPGGDDPPMQFVHLEDVADATLEILATGVTGPFNVAPEDWFTIRELAKMSGRLTIPVPFWLCKSVTACWWTCRLPIFRFPPALWNFIRYPWVLSPARLLRETGFRFRYSSRDVVRQLLADAGKLKEK
jgi:UDP-glucose 4-epimerase